MKKLIKALRNALWFARAPRRQKGDEYVAFRKRCIRFKGDHRFGIGRHVRDTGGAARARRQMDEPRFSEFCRACRQGVREEQRLDACAPGAVGERGEFDRIFRKDGCAAGTGRARSQKGLGPAGRRPQKVGVGEDFAGFGQARKGRLRRKKPAG